jgi:hypothetical protein
MMPRTIPLLQFSIEQVALFLRMATMAKTRLSYRVGPRYCPPQPQEINHERHRLPDRTA